MADPALIIAGHVRPYPGETVAGDTWCRVDTATAVRLALIDGAGHGPHANEAAMLASAVIAELSASPVDQVLKACHSRLHGTRGAVISIVEVKPERLSFTGVGNVDARLIFASGPQQRLSPDRGLLGAAIPKTIHTWSSPLESADWRLVMFSDGVMQRMSLDWDLLEDLANPDALVTDLISRWGRDTDDATIVLAAPSPLTTQKPNRHVQETGA